MLTGGYLRATQNGQEKSISEITVKQISSTKFFSEGFTVSAIQRIKVRGLLSKFSVNYTKGKETESIPDLFSSIIELNQQVGGEAPLPPSPDIQEIEDIRILAGNERFIALAEANEKILTFHEEWMELKKKKEEADDISSRVIPELLAEQGLSELKLQDGSKVSVRKEFRCTLPKDLDKRDAAYKWLRDQGLGDIIKNNVSVTFGKGEDDKAKQLLDLAVENGFQPSQKSDVAWNTLTALFQERVESGLDMPSDVFSTWIKDRTKITRK